MATLAVASALVAVELQAREALAVGTARASLFARHLRRTLKKVIRRF